MFVIRGINDPASVRRREERREERRIIAEENRLRALEQARVRREQAEAEALRRKEEDTKKAFEQGFSGYEEYIRHREQVARDKKILKIVDDIDKRLAKIEMDNIRKSLPD